MDHDDATPEEAAAHYGAALQEHDEARRRTFEVALARLLWSALETREAVSLRVDQRPEGPLREALEAAKIEWDSFGKPFGFCFALGMLNRRALALASQTVRLGH